MSYIINSTAPFISTKLTDKGRENLAKGQLNFSFWGLGDSEINYGRATLEDALPNDLHYGVKPKILRPKDRQPNLKYFIHNGGESPLMPLTASNLKTMKIVVNNEADERGFFTGTTGSYTALTSTGYTKLNLTIPASTFSGGTSVNLGISGTSVNDFILLKSADMNGANNLPVPHLWYFATSANNTTHVVIVDRTLPNLSGITGDVQVLVYQGGEVYDGFGENTTTAYWDTGTLSFDSSCDITREDVPVWNMNNVFMESLAGITGTTYEDNTRFGSHEYVGLGQQYLGLGIDNGQINVTPSAKCDNVSGVGSIDEFIKSFSVLHYTNNTISNLYGEFFYIDNSKSKTVKLHLPTLMYHRRNSAGSGSGTTMGMSFIASGTTQYIDSTDIQYIDLIEDPTLVSLPRAVGKVYPQHKIVVIEDSEIIAAMSYKSNRNWTLPELAINLVAPSGGASSGAVANGKTVYVTYGLENDKTTGFTTPLHCQYYARVTNTFPTPKDIDFRIAETGLFPYMRKIENPSYDGLGFYADKFKLIYQIVEGDARPDDGAWRTVDFTTTALTTVSGTTIEPIKLESQNQLLTGFKLTLEKTSGSTLYDITQSLSMAPIGNPKAFQFGDEKFFYGNIEAFIGATIYKTIFDIRIDSNQFNKTTNPTRSADMTSNPPTLRVSEIGIYDSNNELVLIGKMAEPISLIGGNTIMTELSIDF